MTNLSDLTIMLANISSLKEAQDFLEAVSFCASEQHSEYPEAGAYINGIAGYLSQYNEFDRVLSADQLRIICDVVWGSLYYE